MTAPRARGPDDDSLLAAARALVQISLQAAAAIGGISTVQLRALTVLAESGHANLARLAQLTGVSISTTSRLVDRLIAAGWAQRRLAAHSRREVELRLTSQGRQLLQRYDTDRLAQLRAHLDQLPAADREVAAAGLRAFGAAGHQVPPQRTPASGPSSEPAMSEAERTP